mgnify:CR=1 FL=1
MDAFELSLLNQFQRDFPLVARPFAAMAERLGCAEARVLDTLRAQQVTVMIALHDLKLASTSFDRVMLLNRRLVGIGIPSVVFSRHNLALAYGERMHFEIEGTEIPFMDDDCCGGEEDHHA